MTEEEPEYLYKYRSLRGMSSHYVERTLLHNEIFFANPADFNDPFDCWPSFSLDGTNDELANYLARRLWSTWKRENPQLNNKELWGRVLDEIEQQRRQGGIREAVRQIAEGFPWIRNQIGVYSMSATRRHPLMWAHYADSHRGICWRFRHIAQWPFGEANRVDYLDRKPIVNVLHDSADEQIQKVLIVKGAVWRYEAEWRVFNVPVEGSIEGSGVYQFPSPLLEGVILGAKIDQKDKELIERWNEERSRPINIYPASISETEFEIDIPGL